MLLDTEVQVKKEDEKPVDLTDEIKEKNTGKIILYLYVSVSFACLIPLRGYCSSADWSIGQYLMFKEFYLNLSG